MVPAKAESIYPSFPRKNVTPAKAGAGIHVSVVIPAQAGIHVSVVIPAKAGIHVTGLWMR
jgi:hypothetical protein